MLHASYLPLSTRVTRPKHASPPDRIRIAWAGVNVNDNLEKTVPTYPDVWEQLCTKQVANKRYKFSADGIKQYRNLDILNKEYEYGEEPKNTETSK